MSPTSTWRARRAATRPQAATATALGSRSTWLGYRIVSHTAPLRGPSAPLPAALFPRARFSIQCRKTWSTGEFRDAAIRDRRAGAWGDLRHFRVRAGGHLPLGRHPELCVRVPGVFPRPLLLLPALPERLGHRAVRHRDDPAGGS